MFEERCFLPTSFACKPSCLNSWLRSQNRLKMCSTCLFSEHNVFSKSLLSSCSCCLQILLAPTCTMTFRLPGSKNASSFILYNNYNRSDNSSQVRGVCDWACFNILDYWVTDNESCRRPYVWSYGLRAGWAWSGVPAIQNTQLLHAALRI